MSAPTEKHRETARRISREWFAIPFSQEVDVIAEALAAAEERGMKRERERLEDALDLYRAGLGEIPLGHENRQRGASTYNWKVAVFEEVRSAILYEITPSPAAPSQRATADEGVSPPSSSSAPIHEATK